MPEKKGRKELNLDELFLDIQQKRGDGLKDLGSYFKPEENRGTGGIVGALDMSDGVRDVYLRVMKLTSATQEEICGFFEDKELTAVYLNILVRQKYLEKIKENGKTVYQAVHEKRAEKTLSDDIWDALGD